MVQERRGMLKLWNMNLVVGTFVLTILGTFLTRSGIISSVHAFTQGTIGYYFLAFIAFVLLGSAILVAGNSDTLRTEGRFDTPLSRETIFLFNNLFLTVFMFTVLVGTLFPLVAEAIRGVKVSVGEPFFNRMTLPVVVALLFLMGVGPALPWKRGSASELQQKAMPGIIAGVALAVVVLALGARSPYGVLAFAFGGFAAALNIGEFVAGVRARRAAHGEAPLTALARLVAANRRRYGGYVAHLGIFVVALGVAASSTFRTEREATLKPGETLTLGRVNARLKDVWGREEPQRDVIGATVELVRDGVVHATLTPRMNIYPMSQQPVPTPDVRSTPLGDTYINLMSFAQDGTTATIKVINEPLVPWIWLGGGVICLGAVLAGWPARRSA
jgi:cytochrome c-type biogenesis protein CcmF